eukprot:343228_1
MSLICSLCNESKHKYDFSKSQIRKNRSKKCKDCIKSKRKHQWNECAKYPTKLGKSDLIKINQINFISFSTKCYIYNIITEKWTVLFEISNLNNIHAITIDYNNNEIYILTKGKHKVKILTFKHDKPYQTMKTLKLNNRFDKNENISSIFANHQYHLIRTCELPRRYLDNKIPDIIDFLVQNNFQMGYDKMSYHYIWNKQQTKLDKIHKFDGNKSECKLIYIKSKDMILLINIDTYYEPCESFCYSLKHSKWRKWKINFRNKLAFENWITHSYILTADERFVIFFGTRDEIAVLDVMKQKVIQNKIKCPKGGPYKAVLMNGHVRVRSLISAYYISCWNKLNVTNIPVLPMEINEMILNIYGEETFVHLVSCNGTSHYKINVKNILNDAKIVRIFY